MRKTITKPAAKSLAVSYAAFMCAQEQKDTEGRAFWARILLSDQEATGVELIGAEALRYFASNI